ncbi:MAG: multiheme c-type cytochrome [Planctomycetota bacterium]|jgi:hypothetical protein
MNWESILVILVVAVVTGVPLYHYGRTWTRRLLGTIIFAWLLGCVAFASVTTVYPRADFATRTEPLRPMETDGQGYVTSDACQSCHPDHYASWFDSYHRTMTQPATSESIHAPWNGTWVTARGETYRFERRGDEFWVEMPASTIPGRLDSTRTWRQVVQVTGSHHWQFYWYATGRNRELALLLCSYRMVDEPRWMPLDGCCIAPPDKGQGSGTARWHKTCVKCHATHGRPRINEHGGIDTHVAELGIACEACHGPGAAHVAVNRNPLRRYRLHDSGELDDTIVNPVNLDHRRASQVCGQCHSVNRFLSQTDRNNWIDHGFQFRPGEDLYESRQVDQNGPIDKFWSDGMIRVSGREYNGLIESPCYIKGKMSCMSCHSLHQPADDPRPREVWADDQFTPGMDGDLACTQCHEGFDTPKAIADHTHHAVGTAGSLCYNCHMPHTTYGLLKAIRSHEVSSPNASVSLATGRPDACSQCHLDRTLAWTAKWLHEWYKQDIPELPAEHKEISASLIWGLKGDAGQRALFAWAMGWDAAREASGQRWMVPYLAILMDDPYNAVRYIAHRSARDLPDFQSLSYDFMDDRAVRSPEAFGVFAAWHRNGGGGDAAENSTVLIDANHALKIDIVNRLRSEQDTRPLTLNE